MIKGHKVTKSSWDAFNPRTLYVIEDLNQFYKFRYSLVNQVSIKLYFLPKTNVTELKTEFILNLTI